MSKEWNSLTALVTHHTVMRELLPCLLVLPWWTAVLVTYSSQASSLWSHVISAHCSAISSSTSPVPVCNVGEFQYTIQCNIRLIKVDWTQLQTRHNKNHTCNQCEYLYSCLMIKMPVIDFTLWRPLLPHGYSYKASRARPGKAVICNFWHLGTLTLSLERQSARMSQITNDGLTRSGTGCFIAVPIWQQWASNG